MVDSSVVVLKYLCFFSLRVICFVILVGCSGGTRVPAHKYWHAGSEKPYIIKNVTYYPQTHYHYDKIGIASWYGYDCHGLATATGKKFDKNKLTAAHRTLPLPCIVIVENLANGKKIKLLVNDRGPFAKTDKRIIDVSQKAAELLRFKKSGYTRVRVTCLPEESRQIALKYKRKPY
ncbi:MAG: septal ring lytic transglycosylase RlpA family protein [Holosporaceae bacterium]|jgi:rare lipoprotein A|nr:septal ring lytic transglycosylase RlpA family protein [Holosporaceae bacterium]